MSLTAHRYRVWTESSINRFHSDSLQPEHQPGLEALSLLGTMMSSELNMNIFYTFSSLVIKICLTLQCWRFCAQKFPKS